MARQLYSVVRWSDADNSRVVLMEHVTLTDARNVIAVNKRRRQENYGDSEYFYWDVVPEEEE